MPLGSLEVSAQTLTLKSVPAGIESIPAQEYGASQALEAYKKKRGGFLIGDERGAGKTMTALRFLSSVPGFKLILCQASLLKMWEDAIAKYGLREYHGIYICQSSQWLVSGVSLLNENSYLIMSQALIAKNVKLLTKLLKEMETVVTIDEAHTFKGCGEKISKLAKTMFGGEIIKDASGLGLSSHARFVLQLTGTIAPNARHKEMYNILRCNLQQDEIWDKQWNNYYEFARIFCGGNNNPYIGIYQDDKNTEKMHFAQLLARCSVLHSKDEVEKTPGLIRNKINIPADALITAWRQEAAQGLGIPANELHKIEAMVIRDIQRKKKPENMQGELSTLLERTALWKVPKALNHILGLLNCDATSPVLVFGRHLQAIYALVRALRDAGWRTGYIVGGTPVQDRNAIVKAFQEGKYDVLVTGYQPGGTGLTLTRAHRIVLMELSWTAAEIDQAEGRCDRKGQTKKVIVDWLLVEDTIDKSLARIVQKKLRDSAKLLDNARSLQKSHKEAAAKDKIPAGTRSVLIAKPINARRGTAKLGAIKDIHARVLELVHNGVPADTIPNMFQDLQEVKEAEKFIDYLRLNKRLEQ